MPNWNFTTYHVTGDPKKCLDLYKKIKSLDEMETSLCENGFGKLWCGNLVHLLGGDETDAENLYCRGQIVIYELKPNFDVTFSVESAWGELSQFRHFIEDRIGGIKIYHISEEPGIQIFVSNDIEGKYFKYNKYYLDICDDEKEIYATDYFADLKGAKKLLNKVYKGVRFGKTFEEIKAKIAELEENNEDICICFEKFKLIDN